MKINKGENNGKKSAIIHLNLVSFDRILASLFSEYITKTPKQSTYLHSTTNDTNQLFFLEKKVYQNSYHLIPL